MIEVAIISLLPKEISNYYLDLRQELEERFGLEMNHSVPAHITFKYGFPVEDLTVVDEVVQGVCSIHPRSVWQLHGFGSFQHPNNHVVFIDCIPTQSVRDIHASLYDGLKKNNWITWAEFDNINLHYHVTLASKGLTSDNLDLVWSFLNKLEMPKFELQLDNLAILRIDSDPPFVSSKFCFPE